MMIKNIKKSIRENFPLRKRILSIEEKISNLFLKLDKVQEAIGRIESRQTHDFDSQNINAYEFQVYSQWGEDGII